MSTVVPGPVIAGWSAVSPYGIGREAFVDGFRSHQATGRPLDVETWRAPDGQACLVPGFVLKDVLGRKGTRSMDRVTGLAVAAVRELVHGGGKASQDATELGLVLGTTTGSAQSMMDITRDTLVHEKPFYIDPSRIPNAIMNCPAGQCAIWHGLKGPNATVAAGRSSGLLALNYARRLLASGRAQTVLCGAAEEFSSARSWLEWHTRGEDETGVVLGEGCAVLQVRPASAVREDEALAEVLAVETGVAPPGEVTEAVTATVRRALRRSGVDPAEIWAVSPSAPAGTLGAQEQAGLRPLFDDTGVRWVPQPELMGDTAAATGAFQVVSVLTVAAEDSRAAGRVAVVTSTDRDGALACALLRIR